MIFRSFNRIQFSNYFWLIRPLNCTTAAFAVVLAVYLALGENLVNFNLIVFIPIATAAFFVTAHSMVHNDLVDYDLDKINAPHRPLASGKISLINGKIFFLILGLAAITSGVLIDISLDIFPFSCFWAILNMSILDIYNYRLKKSGLFGNFVIGYVVSALFIYADIIVNGGLTMLSINIGGYTFFVIWGREIFKDIYDIEGDKEFNIKSIPVLYGRKVGAVVGSVLIVIGILFSIPIIFDENSSNLLKLIFGVLHSITIYICIKIIKNSNNDDLIKSFKRLLLRILLLGILSYLLVNNLFETLS